MKLSFQIYSHYWPSGFDGFRNISLLLEKVIINNKRKLLMYVYICLLFYFSDGQAFDLEIIIKFFIWFFRVISFGKQNNCEFNQKKSYKWMHSMLKNKSLIKML
jgi:hypothetical protein